QLAEKLGRWFEARGWWTLAGSAPAHAVEARTALVRLDRLEQNLASTRRSMFTERPKSEPVQTSQPRTLADAVADLIPHDRRDQSSSPPPVTVPIFRDDAQAVGLHFAYDNDATPMCRMPETMGGGVGLLDYDGDGWLDVYAVQGGQLSNESIPAASVQ